MTTAPKTKQILTGEKRVSKYALVKPALQYQLSEDVARDQLMMLLGYYDIDLGRISADTDSGEAVLTQLERSFDALVDYIRLGKLEIRKGTGDKLEVVHTLESGSVVVYGEVCAQAKLAMDKCPQGSGYARSYALMGSLSSLGSAGIEKFPAKDLAIVEVLAALFLIV